MKQFFRLLFFGCACLFIACGQTGRHKKTKVIHDIEVQEKDTSSNDLTDLDTSLVNLKTFRNVAVTDVLSQVWKMEDADRAHWNEIFWDSIANTRQYPELALFSDHTFSANARCTMQMGKWSLDKGTGNLILQGAGGRNQVYGVEKIALKQMLLTRPEKDGEARIRLSAGAVVHRRLTEDPFYPANNSWRVKPASPETQEQIKERIRGCVHFYSLFFLDNHKRQEKEISFSGLPSCFVWYNGGIGMQVKLELDKKWIACFYSKEQAMTAYEMISDQLGSHTLKWPEHPTSWVEQTGQVLDQLSHKF